MIKINCFSLKIISCVKMSSNGVKIYFQKYINTYIHQYIDYSVIKESSCT